MVSCKEPDECISYGLQATSSSPSPVFSELDTVDFIGPNGIHYHALYSQRERADVALCLFDPNKPAVDIPLYSEYFRYLGYDSFMLLASSTCTDGSTLPTIVEHLVNLGYSQSRILVYAEGSSFRLPLVDGASIRFRGAVLVAVDYASSLLKTSDITDRLNEGLGFPVLIAHGDQDQQIPISRSFNLYEQIGSTSPKRLVILNAIGHNDVFYSDDFSQALMGMFPSRSGLSDTLPRVKW
jgi:pimeloyl-ACP methyl ester carboxylesterase